MRTRIAAVVAVSVVSVAGLASAEPPFDGLPWLWPHVITADDRSSLVDVAYEGRGRRLFHEHWRWIEMTVHLYRASYRGGQEIEVHVSPEWRRRRGRRAQNGWERGDPPYDSPRYEERTERERLTAEVEFIASVIGRLPAILRERIEVASLDAGYSHPGANRPRRTVHFLSRYNDKMESFGSTEEMYIHEAGHLLEDEYAVTDCWRDAQVSDGEFISEYAASDPGSGRAGDPSGPGGEDFAETLVAYYALRHHPDRLAPEVRRTIQETIPARIACMDGWGFGSERPGE